MSSFRRSITVVSRGTGSYVDGTYVEAVGALRVIQASVQPATQTEVLALPEGRREQSAFTIYTDSELVSLEISQNPDRVTLDALEYEVIKKEAWQNSVINHYKYLVVKV